MKKSEFVELIKESPQLRGNYHLRVIELNISRAYSQLVDAYLVKNPQNNGYFRKQYIAGVNKDSATGLKYCLLPEKTIKLKDSANSVIVSRTKGFGSGIDFVPVSEDEMNLIQELDVGRVDNVCGYVLRGDRIEFDNNISDDIEAVMLRLIIPFDRYDEDDEVDIPGNFELEILTMIVKIMGGQMVEDASNDGNPNTY